MSRSLPVRVARSRSSCARSTVEGAVQSTAGRLLHVEAGGEPAPVALGVELHLAKLHLVDLGAVDRQMGAARRTLQRCPTDRCARRALPAPP